MQNLLEAENLANQIKDCEAFSDWETFFSTENDALLDSENDFDDQMLIVQTNMALQESGINSHNNRILNEDFSKGTTFVSPEPINSLSWRDITLEELTNLSEFEVTKNAYPNIADTISSNTSKGFINQGGEKSPKKLFQENYAATLSKNEIYRSSVQEKPFCTTEEYVKKNFNQGNQPRILIENCGRKINYFDRNICRSQTMLISHHDSSRSKKVNISTQGFENEVIPALNKGIYICQEMINCIPGTLKKNASCQESCDSQRMIVLNQQSNGDETVVFSQESNKGKTTIISSQESLGSQMIVSSQESSISHKMIISSQESSGSQKMIVASQESSGSQTMIVSSQESSGSQKMIVSSQESSGSQSMIVSSQESLRSQNRTVSRRDGFETIKEMIFSQESSENQKTIVSSLESCANDSGKVLSRENSKDLRNCLSIHEMFGSQILDASSHGTFSKELMTVPTDKNYVYKQIFFPRCQDSFNKFHSNNVKLKRQKSNKYYVKSRKSFKLETDCLNP